MYRYAALAVLGFTLSSMGQAQTPPFATTLDTQAITQVMQAIADWQLYTQPFSHRANNPIQISHNTIE
ncbi:hypothetical protein ACFL6U_26065 [Planctomycetota bacterium]